MSATRGFWSRLAAAIALLSIAVACGGGDSAPASAGRVPSLDEAARIASTLAESRDPTTHFKITEGPTASRSGKSGLAAAVATRHPTADGKGQIVLVWEDGKFQGLLEDVEVLAVREVHVRDGEIVVEYVAYAESDALCCPSLPPVSIAYTRAAGDWVGDMPLPASTFREPIRVRVP